VIADLLDDLEKAVRAHCDAVTYTDRAWAVYQIAQVRRRIGDALHGHGIDVSGWIPDPSPVARIEALAAEIDVLPAGERRRARDAWRAAFIDSEHAEARRQGEALADAYDLDDLRGTA
jgi:hypothetical protein